MTYNKHLSPGSILILILALGMTAQLSARATADSLPPKSGEGRIVQAGSAAFIVQNALYLFPEAYDRVVAVADGNQGSGFFLGDLDSSLSSGNILPRTANTESILSLAPDTVVMKNFMKGRMGEPLDKLGVSTFYLDLETPEGWMSDLERLGELFNNKDRAEELKNHFQSRIEAVTDALETVTEKEKPETLLLYWSVKDGVTAVNVPPMDWIQTRMVEMAGGKPVWRDADLNKGWTRTNLEQVAAWDPELIVVAAYHIPASEAVEAILEDPIWASLSAVKNGRVHAFPSDYHSWDQPDARWLLGLSWLASELHPDRFSSLDMESEVRKFYKEMFFLDDSAYESLISPRLSGLD